MNSIIKKILPIVNKLEYNLKIIDVDDITSYAPNDDIYDIKDYNDIDKIILELFIYNTVYLNPEISKYNMYSYFLYPNIKIINYNNISRSFFTYIDIFTKNNINKNIKNILQVGIFPNILEAYNIYNNTHYYHSYFIQNKINTNNNLYENLITKISNNIRNFTCLKKIQNYDYDLLLNDKKKFDIICFTAYKNIEKIHNYFISNRSISSIIHFKYIFYQIIFILNSLNIGGEFILLIPAYNHNIYAQLVYLLKFFFEDITLYYSELDMSYRIFIIGKNYLDKPSDLISINLIYQQILKLKKDEYLIKIFNDIDENFNYNDFIIQLNYKFEFLYKEINELKPLIDHEPISLIKQIYFYIYHYKLKNTFNFLINNINKKYISKELKKKLEKFEKYILKKLILKKNIEYFITENFYFYKFYILNKNITYDQFYNLLTPLRYIKTYDYLFYDNIFTYQKNILIISKIKKYKKIFKELKHIFINYNMNVISFIDIIKYINNNNNNNNNNNIIYSHDKEDLEHILNYYNIKNIIYIDFITYKNNKIEYIFDNYDYIIKFDLYSMSPLLLSVIYILSKYFVECKFIKNTLSIMSFYFICNKYNKIQLGKIITLLNNNLSENLYLVQINEKFINDINNILFKFIQNNIKYIMIIKYIQLNKLNDIYHINTNLNKYYKTIIFNR